MAAMNSFIQELRNLSSTSSASSIDSGFTGDSNAGSGRATANQPQNLQTIWGNKSLWGGPPLSPPATSKSSPPPSAAQPQPQQESMYVSKDSPPAAASPWATAVLSPSQPAPQPQAQSPSFSPSIWENSGPKAAAEAASLGSIWMIPEADGAAAAVARSGSVWGESTAPKAPSNSQLLRPMEIGGSKLSSLWAPNAATQPAASGANVLKSLRLAGTVGAGSGPSSSFGLGGLTTTPATAAQQLFSDEFLSYLNINN